MKTKEGIQTPYIFLIEKIWFDPMENDVCRAAGYDVCGFVYSEDKAMRICEQGETFTSERCWAVTGKMPEYRYRGIEYFGITK